MDELILSEGQLINNDFVVDYHGKAVRNNAQFKVEVQNVQDVLNKMKEKGYDRKLINQLMAALNKLVKKKSKERIQQLLEYELASLELRLIEYDVEPTPVHLGKQQLLEYELASLELRLIEYDDEHTPSYLGNTFYFISFMSCNKMLKKAMSVSFDQNCLHFTILPYI